MTVGRSGNFSRVGRDRWARRQDARIMRSSRRAQRSRPTKGGLRVGRTGPVRRDGEAGAIILTAHRAGAPYLKTYLEAHR